MKLRLLPYLEVTEMLRSNDSIESLGILYVHVPHITPFWMFIPERQRTMFDFGGMKCRFGVAGEMQLHKKCLLAALTFIVTEVLVGAYIPNGPVGVEWQTVSGCL
eukprot:GHVS01025040.1.p2 GENE.GHVS01025040.1~~GHVS01025040.1.p2  ORF type:complete len:105 (+),score=8.75 GHVS01025040.1:366-680(+)